MDSEEIHLHHYITNLQSELPLEPYYLLCLIFGNISMFVYVSISGTLFGFKQASTAHLTNK